MKKIIACLLILLFFIRNDVISSNALIAFNLWLKNLLPIIFPTLCLADFLLASEIFNPLIKRFGKIFEHLFHISKSGIIVFLISLIAGTPTNMKVAKYYYDNNLLTTEDINKLIPLTLFFNPLFVIKFTSKKVLIILIITSIISGILFRNKKYSLIKNDYLINKTYNFNESINNNINILFSILGTVIIFMILSNLIIIKKPLFSCLFLGIMEITSGLYKVNLFFKGNNYFYLFLLVFGGLSIIFQIKGILKDIKIDFKYFFIQRLTIFLLSILICFLT